MDRRDIKSWLRRYRGDQIDYSAHVEEDKFETRKVEKADVKRNLLNPANLVQAVEQEPEEQGKIKYKLHFKHSRSKDLGIVVLLNDRIKVITAYMIEKKWQDKMMWWHEKRNRG